MKKNLKKAAALLLTTAMALTAVTGCSGSGKEESTGDFGTESGTAAADNAADDESKDQPAASGERVELTCWVRASSSENNQTKTFDEFNASQDKIHVNVECYGDNYAEVLKLAFNSGEAPDIFEVTGGVDVKSYVDAELVAPLDEFMTEDFKAQFNPSAFVVHNYDGGVYAIPDMTRFIRVYYNKDLFEASGLDPETPPASLEELYDMAKKITETGNGEYYGFGLPIKSGSTWERNVDDIAILSGLTGPYAFDYTTGRFDFSKQKPVIEFFAKMYKDGLLMPGSESIDVEMIRANFVAGKIGMYLDGNWMINGYNNEIEGGRDTNWETALVPVFEGTNRAKDYLMLESGRCISATSEHKAEAFEAIEYALHNIYTAPTRLNPEVVLPSFSLIEADNKLVNEKPEVKALKGMVGATQEEDKLSAFSVTPHSVLTLEGDSRDVVYPLLVIQGDSMDIDEELNKLSETYNAALDKAIADGLLNEADLKPEGFDYYTR